MILVILLTADFNTLLGTLFYKDGIFHLAGIKGSPQMMKKRPSDFFVPLIQFNTNMIEASRLANVKFFLYASSIGVYSPAKIFKENKNFLGINKFNLVSEFSKNPIVALGGISQKNEKLIRLTKAEGIAGISYFENKKKGP